MSQDSRNHGLDGLRGLAAIAVVTTHVWMFDFRGQHPRDAFVNMAMGELRLALMLFFALSGYLLLGPWVARALDDRRLPTLGRYTSARVARVVPAYWVAALGAMLMLAGSGHPYEIPLVDLPIFILFAQNYFEHTAGKLDPPMWSLVVEVAFYVVLPLIGWGVVRAASRLRALALLGALAAAGVAYTAVGEALAWPRTAMATLPVFLPVLCCGMAAAVLAHGRRLSRGGFVALLLAGIALVLANGAWHSQGTGFVGHAVRDLPAGAGFAAIVAAVALRPQRLLELWPLRGLGVISYAIYLWHMPVLIWLRLQDAWPENYAVAWILVFVPTVAIATASWFVVERPVLNFLRRRARLRSTSTPAGVSTLGRRPASISVRS